MKIFAITFYLDPAELFIEINFERRKNKPTIFRIHSTYTYAVFSRLHIFLISPDFRYTSMYC